MFFSLLQRSKIPLLIAASWGYSRYLWKRFSSRRQRAPAIVTKAPSINLGEQQPQQKKPFQRPPSLKIKTSPPKQQSPPGNTKDDPQPPSKSQGSSCVAGDGIRKRPRGNSLTFDRLHSNSEGNSEYRRGSLQPGYARGISQDAKGSHAPYTPKVFKSALEYNRFIMKKPSSLSTPTPAGQDPASLKQLGYEESYLPQITKHTRNWPAFLARNFFHLMNIRLVLTLLINLILLTFQVRLPSPFSPIPPPPPPPLSHFAAAGLIPYAPPGYKY